MTPDGLRTGAREGGSGGRKGAEDHGRGHRKLRVMADTTGQTRRRSKATREEQRDLG